MQVNLGDTGEASLFLSKIMTVSDRNAVSPGYKDIK